MTKKLFTILSIVILIFAFSACAAKAQSYQGNQNEIVMTIDNKEVSLFGQKTQNDVAPIISNGRTMLPARLVAEALGANVLWDENKRKVTVTRNDITIEMHVDSDIVYINGKKHKLDSTVFIQDSRTYTPVRFIAELLDAKVSWLGETRQVVINKEPLVTNAVNYTKKIIDYYGWNQDYGNHTINIPKINIDTPAAVAFNQKIFAEYEDRLTKVKNNQEKEEIYRISYQYAVNNGVVAILISNPNMGQGRGYGEKYDGYYYDTSADKELSFSEYLNKLNVDFKKLTNETNAIYEATTDQYDDHDLVASFSSKNRVENALLSPGRVIVSHYSNHGVAVGDRLVELDCSIYDIT